MDDVVDNIKDNIPRGDRCLVDDQCSFFEYCETYSEQGIDFHCRIHLWVWFALVATAVALVLALGLSCICCPCCCLYNLCRKT